MAPLRIFLSAVSSEFTSVRELLFKELEKHGFDVTYQDKLVSLPEADRTLDKVYTYFQDCDLVIYIVGLRSGGFPATKVAEKYAHLLPKGVTHASYTQWEYFFSNEPRLDGKERRRLFYFAEGYDEGRPLVQGEDPAPQQHFIEMLKEVEGHDRPRFTNEHHLLSQIKDQTWFKQGLRHQPNNLPYPSIGSLFVGRETVMQQLQESLTAHHQTAIKPRRAIHGLGGIGKTRLATEYAWYHQEHYSALLFVIAETPEALRRNLAALCGPLVLDLQENDAQEEEVKMAAALRWLQQHTNWFLLVDNVDSPEALAAAEQLLGNLAGGHVVYTSRMSSWGAGVETLELDVLAEEVSTRFIMERTAKRRRREPDVEAHARLIAQDVDGLALALEQACAYINERRLTLAGYRTLWQEKHNEVLLWYDPQVMKYPKSVAITWQTSMDQLSAEAQQLLMRLAWLSPEPIPVSLLDVRTGINDALDKHAGLVELAKYSLVSRSNEVPHFSVHRLLQDVVRSAQLRERNALCLGGAIDWIGYACDVDIQNAQFLKAIGILIPHIEMLCAHARNLGGTYGLPYLLSVAGSYYLHYATLLDDAERTLRASYDLSTTSSSVQIENVIGGGNNLAQVLKAKGRTADATALMKRTLEYAEKHLLADNPIFISLLNNVGTNALESGQFEDSISLFERALNLAEKCYGVDDSSAAPCLHNLADALSTVDRLPEALVTARRSLTITEKHKGANSDYVAKNLNILARVLGRMGRIQEAEDCMRRGLQIRRENLPSDHPELSIALNNLAELLWRTGRIDEAEPYMKEHLRILVKVSRKNNSQHKYLEHGKANYAHVLRDMGKSEGEVLQLLDAILLGG